jgi:glycosyltransferase involved in cell wall biosynthesis
MDSVNNTELLNSDHNLSDLIESEDISIVMAVYNHEATVADALESALNQQMPYKSIIYCLNDASTDKSAEILNDYAQRYPGRIKIYTSKTNQGSGKKSFYHNQPHVKGRYWCLLAGDDYWTSEAKLAKQIAFLDSNPDYVGCSCNTVMKNEATGVESIIKPDRDSWNLLDLILLHRRYAFYVHTTSIIWRNIHLNHGFFLPPSFKKNYASGDVVLGHMMLGNGEKMHNIPEVMSCYRVTGRGVWTSKSEEDQALINKSLKTKINRAIPLKFKLYICLQKLRQYSARFKKIIPGPVNE